MQTVATRTLVEARMKQIARLLRRGAQGLTLCQRWGKLLVMIIRGAHAHTRTHAHTESSPVLMVCKASFFTAVM